MRDTLPGRSNILIVGASLMDAAYNILALAHADHRFIRSEPTTLAASHHADFLSLEQAGCTQTDCVVFHNGYPYTWDQTHFSLEFSSFLSSALAPQLEHTWLGDLHEQALRPGTP